MYVDKLKSAIKFAEEFTARAKVVLHEHRGEIRESISGNYIGGSKHTAAAKRASMDLTRALAGMRRSAP